MNNAYLSTMRYPFVKPIQNILGDTSSKPDLAFIYNADKKQKRYDLIGSWCMLNHLNFDT